MATWNTPPLRSWMTSRRPGSARLRVKASTMKIVAAPRKTRRPANQKGGIVARPIFITGQLQPHRMTTLASSR